MSNGGSGKNRLDKSRRREEAREKARVLREQHQKKEKVGKFLLQGSLIIVSLGIVALVAVIITSSIRPPSPGPRNMLSDGILIGTDFEAETTSALEAGEDPVPNTPPADSDVIPIQIWVDYLCPVCGEFEKANAAQIETLVESGVATLEIHPVAILDRAAQGSRYSSRAANASACVANYSPNQFFEFNALLFENQPEEGTTGLTDDELIGLTEEVNVLTASTVAKCITDEKFKSWVADATERATSNEALLSPESGLFGTPTVFVGGARYTGPIDDATAFAQAIAAADGAAFSEENSASPSPSPTPAP